MSRCQILLAAWLLATPLSVEIPGAGRDSSETLVSIAGGIGRYAIISRGCEGEVLSREAVRFRGGGAGIEHKFAAPVRVGLRGGLVRLDREGVPGSPFDRIRNNIRDLEVRYLNPHVALEWRTFSIGGGYVQASDPIPTSWGRWSIRTASGHLRIGDAERQYFSIEFLEDVTPMSSGAIQTGIGFRPGPRVLGWAGMSVGPPYDQPGFAARLHFRIRPELQADLRSRLGNAEGVDELALSLGVTYALSGRAKRD